MKNKKRLNTIDYVPSEPYDAIRSVVLKTIKPDDFHEDQHYIGLTPKGEPKSLRLGRE